MTITAEMVKALRERTGAGMMECKKALVETDGNLDAADEIMRKSGLAKADKKAARIAADGVVVAAGSADGKSAALAEVNCETDFVARQPEFQAFATQVGEAALKAGASEPEAIAALRLADGKSTDETRRHLIAKIGEKIDVRRVGILQAPDRVGRYVHGIRIGSLVGLRGGDDALAKQLAMHVAWANPRFISPADVPADVLASEREIQVALAAKEGKPPEIAAKMVEGRLRKRLNEICLTGQAFEQLPDKPPVEKLLKAAGATVTGFLRYEVGEGIEKKQENFAAEVAAQVEAAKGKSGEDGPKSDGPGNGHA